MEWMGIWSSAHEWIYFFLSGITSGASLMVDVFHGECMSDWETSQMRGLVMEEQQTCPEFQDLILKKPYFLQWPSALYRKGIKTSKTPPQPYRQASIIRTSPIFRGKVFPDSSVGLEIYHAREILTLQVNCMGWCKGPCLFIPQCQNVELQWAYGIFSKEVTIRPKFLMQTQIEGQHWDQRAWHENKETEVFPGQGCIQYQAQVL